MTTECTIAALQLRRLSTRPAYPAKVATFSTHLYGIEYFGLKGFGFGFVIRHCFGWLIRLFQLQSGLLRDQTVQIQMRCRISSGSALFAGVLFIGTTFINGLCPPPPSGAKI